ncbi:unnamed protein product [Wuchereria bancrofti]|uniref:Uncharacterized protein n=1 Tax=Wuchereria bancrofti TaxID=6293 RepID=A0A3P7DWZ0_WUCBA|nr:unnamed protein product [Wuchereria bancrofti]
MQIGMLPKLVEAFSDTYDEDMMLYPVQEKLFGLDSMSSGCKVVTQIRKLTSFLERGVIKGTICFLTTTGTALGAIEQISKKIEHSINETINELSRTERAAREEESFPLSYLVR